jgi:AraC family transcriptional regulator, regulatory protein of adaptative response / methylphosphotriester-DNA alkyltransferase methyltransferase
VAAAVGYRQAAQFAKAFRRSHGAPPSSFRGANGGPTPLRHAAGSLAA